jgi:hypothetical protein
MHLPPSFHQHFLVICDSLQSFLEAARLHARGFKHLGLSSRLREPDLCLTITNHVNVRRRVIVGKDDDPQAVGAQDCDHVAMT